MTTTPTLQSHANHAAHRRERLLTAVIVVACIGSLSYRLVTAGRSRPDGAGRLFSEYREAAAALAGAGLSGVGFIGFVAAAPEGVDASAARFLATDAFAPQLVVSDLRGATSAVSTPAAPEALDADPRLAAFELIAVTPNRIRVYRRRP